MTRYSSYNVQPVKLDGTKPVMDANGYATLVAGQTYVYPVAEADADKIGFEVAYDGAIVATVTMEDTYHREVADTENAGGHWVQQNPTSAYIAVSPAGTATPTAATLAVPGGTAAGAAEWSMEGLDSERQRIKVVVGGTGGVLRVTERGK